MDRSIDACLQIDGCVKFQQPSFKVGSLVPLNNDGSVPWRSSSLLCIDGHDGELCCM